MTKYRIVKGYSKVYNEPVYIIQERYLWFFWVNISRYCISVYTLEEVFRELKRITCKKQNKKEVLYEE